MSHSLQDCGNLAFAELPGVASGSHMIAPGDSKSSRPLTWASQPFSKIQAEPGIIRIENARVISRWQAGPQELCQDEGEGLMAGNIGRSLGESVGLTVV